MKLSKITDLLLLGSRCQTIDEQSLVSKPHRLWSTDEVALWLKLLGLKHLTHSFKDNKVDGDVLEELNEEDLRALGVREMKDMKIIKQEISKLKERTSQFSFVSSTTMSIVIKCDVGKKKPIGFTFCVNRKTITFNELIELVNASIKTFTILPRFEYVDEQGDLIKIRKASQFRVVLTTLCQNQSRITLCCSTQCS